MTARETREQQTRQVQERVKAWRNPNELLDPEPRPGIVHRWVRISSYGWKDTRNMTAKFREGWEPCDPDEYPEFKHFVNQETGQIELGGLILCRTAEEIMDQRRAHFTRMAATQIEAIDNHMMREQDSRMPWIKPERQTREQFGDGKPPVRRGRS